MYSEYLQLLGSIQPRVLRIGLVGTTDETRSRLKCYTKWIKNDITIWDNRFLPIPQLLIPTPKIVWSPGFFPQAGTHIWTSTV